MIKARPMSSWLQTVCFEVLQQAPYRQSHLQSRQLNLGQASISTHSTPQSQTTQHSPPCSSPNNWPVQLPSSCSSSLYLSLLHPPTHQLPPAVQCMGSISKSSGSPGCVTEDKSLLLLWALQILMPPLEQNSCPFRLSCQGDQKKWEEMNSWAWWRGVGVGAGEAAMFRAWLSERSCGAASWLASP